MSLPGSNLWLSAKSRFTSPGRAGRFGCRRAAPNSLATSEKPGVEPQVAAPVPPTLVLPQPWGSPFIGGRAARAGLDGDPDGLADGFALATVIAASVPLTPLPSAHATRTVVGAVAAPSAFLGFRSRTRSPAVNV